MNNFINMLNITEDIEKIIYIIKMFYISICTYYAFYKVTDIKYISIKSTFIVCIFTVLISIICGEVRYNLDYLSSILCLVILTVSLYTMINKNKFIYNMVGFIICLAINYIIFFISIILAFFPNIVFLDAQNDWINLFLIMTIHIIIIHGLFKIKRFKNGFQFLKKNNINGYFDILILNISMTIVLACIIAKSLPILENSSIFLILILLAIIIYMTIKCTLTMYYKHKKLIEELNQTKEELENTKKDRDRVDEENIQISKKSHSISHKIESLENKLKELEMKYEIANELEIKDTIENIKKEYNRDKATVQLSKTGIGNIDDMLNCMKNKCAEENIDFELQLNGNIHYMTNHFVTKEELEILLADHIKDAIIAIKHTDNINRSILVRLGLIEEFYSLYIYDSGIEFEIDTLLNLGTKPVTTHADEGGTGMGFLNTFDTLKKHKASMVINEIGKPSKDNYTKVIMIKFDGKDEFEIKSYREEEIEQKGFNKNTQIDIT